MPEKRPLIVGIGGFQSNSGKTTLLCELLRLVPRWEAIKTTRGHYRSCGKDPHSCCVSHLLGDHAIVRSGRAATYANGKDTGRYWESGASNVHWVIAAEDQIGNGISEALKLVRGPGVFVEGNSFAAHVDVDAMFMVASVAGRKIKKSARPVLERSSGLILTKKDFFDVTQIERDEFIKWLDTVGSLSLRLQLPIYLWDALPQLAAQVHQLGASIAA